MDKKGWNWARRCCIIAAKAAAAAAVRRRQKEGATVDERYEKDERHEKQKLLCLRICAAACVGVLVVAAVSAAVLVPRALAALDGLQRLTAVDWNALEASVRGGLDQVSRTLEALDIDSLNQALADLQAVIAPLARLMGG